MYNWARAASARSVEVNGPTQEQIDSYQRDGFLVVEEYMGADEL